MVLDDYAHLLDRDRAVRDGHAYSDKAPGQPFYAVPVMLAGRAMGIVPATAARERVNLDLWWVTFWSATLIGAAVLVQMYVRVRDKVPSHAISASMALFFGSMLLPFSALLFGHVMAALLLFSSYLLLTRSQTSRSVFVAGFLAGCAVFVEYTTVIGVAVLSASFAWRRAKGFGLWALGGSLMAIPLSAYNAAAFGHPLHFSYQYTAFEQIAEHARPVMHMFSPASLDNFSALFFSGRGIAVATPLVLCAVIGAVVQLRRSFDSDALIGLLMFGAFLLIPIFWSNPWGGSAPGPRYMTPALPFLALPLAWSWRRWPNATRLAVGISVLTMVAALIVQAMPTSEPAGLGVWLKLLTMGITTDTLWVSGIGRWGWMVHALSAAALLVYLRRMRSAEVHRLAALGDHNVVVMTK